MSKAIENVIEWLNGDKQMSCTFAQKKFVNRVKKMAKKYPDEIKIVAKNRDGSIYVKMPLNAIHIYLLSSNDESEEDEDSE